MEERLQFVKPPDESVASWFYDYAAIEAATGSLESAKSVLKRALDYGYPSVKVDIQNKLYDQKISWRRTKQKLKYCFVAAVVLGFLVFLYRRKILVIR